MLWETRKNKKERKHKVQNRIRIKKRKEVSSYEC